MNRKLTRDRSREAPLVWVELFKCFSFVHAIVPVRACRQCCNALCANLMPQLGQIDGNGTADRVVSHGGDQTDKLKWTNHGEGEKEKN